MNNNNGIYEAIVTDNKYFLKTGKIKIRCRNMFLTEKMPKDLTGDFSMDKFKKNYSKDLDCFVFNLIGGGTGFGMTHIPQVNAVGLVQFLNGDLNKPVWMGSYSRGLKNEDGKTEEVIIPSDIPESEGVNAFVNGKRNFEGNQSTIVLRTKKTFPIKSDDAKEASWEDKRTENLIIISEDKVLIRHFTKWDEKDGHPVATKYQDFELSSFTESLDGYENDTEEKIPNISLRSVNTEEDQTSIINLNDQFVSMNFLNKRDGITNIVKNDHEKIEITSLNKKGESSVSTIKPNEAFIKSGSSSVQITDDDVILSAKKTIKLSTDGEISLGDGGNRVLTIPDDMLGNVIPIQTVSNHTLYVSKKLKA